MWEEKLDSCKPVELLVHARTFILNVAGGGFVPHSGQVKTWTIKLVFAASLLIMQL